MADRAERREKRLRLWAKHERLTVAAALAEVLNENDNGGRMAILTVTVYAQAPCAKELRRKGVKQSRARCPTYNRKNETH